MGLEVDGADPEAFCFEPLQEVAADEATGAMDEKCASWVTSVRKWD